MLLNARLLDNLHQNCQGSPGVGQNFLRRRLLGPTHNVLNQNPRGRDQGLCILKIIYPGSHNIKLAIFQ